MDSNKMDKKPQPHKATKRERVQSMNRVFMKAIERANSLDVDEPKLVRLEGLIRPLSDD